MAHGEVSGDKGWSLPTASADDRGFPSDKVSFHAYTSWPTCKAYIDGVVFSDHELRAEAESGILGIAQGLRAW